MTATFQGIFNELMIVFTSSQVFVGLVPGCNARSCTWGQGPGLLEIHENPFLAVADRVKGQKLPPVVENNEQNPTSGL